MRYALAPEIVAVHFPAGTVLVLGVLVTGSGPHAGDGNARRFGLDRGRVRGVAGQGVIGSAPALPVPLVAAHVVTGALVAAATTHLVVRTFRV